jgi:hypothetical protein
VGFDSLDCLNGLGNNLNELLNWLGNNLDYRLGNDNLGDCLARFLV